MNFRGRSWAGLVSSDIELANWLLTLAQDCSTLSREKGRLGVWDRDAELAGDLPQM